MAENKILNVCVTGAAGQISYSIYPFIGTGQIFGKDTRINLRLLDIPQCQEPLKGVVMELEDCNYQLIASIQYGSDPSELFKDLDFGIFLGGFPRKPGMERRDLLKINSDIFVKQGKILNEVAKKTCKSLVIANPANTNCLTLLKNAPSIPAKNFTALTRLDQNRAFAQLAMKAGVTGQDVSNVIIWGNHSNTQYPDIYNGKISGKAISEVITDEAYLKNEFIPIVQKRGAAVMEQRKASSGMSAANAIKDHIATWCGETKEGEVVSMAVYSEGGAYDIVPEGIVCSLPVTTKNGEFTVVKGFQINDFSKEKITASVNELLQEKQETESAGEEKK